VGHRNPDPIYPISQRFDFSDSVQYSDHLTVGDAADPRHGLVNTLVDRSYLTANLYIPSTLD
jgi:hypothetical protein